MRIAAAVLAAGSGVRFGGDKTAARLKGKPVWQWSYEIFASHPQVDEVLLVGNESNLAELSQSGRRAILGGATRQESARLALEALESADLLLLHDAARPFASPRLVTLVIEATQQAGAAAPGLPVSDTIKRMKDGEFETLDRDSLVSMQTPQGVLTELMRKAHRDQPDQHTDDLALLEAIGVHPIIVAGESSNFKITLPEDLARARAHLGGPEFRTGFGYDIHSFSDDPTRTLMLGGVAFPSHRGLDGHSDADVLLHAIADAIFGGASLGDIGLHFPNTDPRWKSCDSLVFLEEAARLVRQEGWEIIHIDSTLVAEAPKVMAHATQIRETIANRIGVDLTSVSLKATTNEKLGSIGRSEGIAAMAVATLRR